MWTARAGAIAVLGALALGSAVGRADDAGKTAPPPQPGARQAGAQQPGAGFLEFLGSVDRLSEVNPNYLSPPPPKAAKPPAANGTTAPITPPPRTASQSGDKNNG